MNLSIIKTTHIALLSGILMTSCSVLYAELPAINKSYNSALATTAGDRLVVSTGSSERTFRWTGHGFVTVGIRNLETGKQWANMEPSVAADWSYPGLIPTDAKAKLLSLTAAQSDDEGFTSPHLEVIAEIHYPAQALTLKQTIWAYPGAHGLRQQLWAKGSLEQDAADANTTPGGRVDYLPVDTSEMQVSSAGYYSDTQHRNLPDTPVLKEENQQSSGKCDWSNLLFVEEGDQALTLIKESHKTVQTYGVDTGLYSFGPQGIENTGWGLNRSDLSPNTYKWIWGSWLITHEAGTDARECAIKQFDRLRFPTNKARDMWIVMCTWGHSLEIPGFGNDGRTYAYEKEILSEMDHVADMGIDMILIDDGWQALAPGSRKDYPQKHKGWYPHPGTYPSGDWSNVTKKAKDLGLRLGLWAAYRISNEEMLWNWERLKPTQIKLDFAKLKTHAALDKIKMKSRNFMLQTDKKCIISWDTTEAAPRYGYYLFREYGNVHFMNRKQKFPDNLLYVPWLALRDFWLLSHYQNLNKWQLVIQNPEVVEKNVGNFSSDAYLHSAAYCTATALMGTPEYMGISRHYSENARKELRVLHSQYKAVRSEIWDSMVYPIGQEPSNKSWTGFQAVHPDGKHGYLTIFRERLNKNKTSKLALRFIHPGTQIKLTNLRTGSISHAVLDANGALEFEIPHAPGFLFLQYDIINSVP